MESQAIQQTQQWLEQVVIGLNFCPFAKKPFMAGKIHFTLIESSKRQQLLESLLTQCRYLDEHDECDTLLMVLASGFDDFYTYLDILSMPD